MTCNLPSRSDRRVRWGQKSERAELQRVLGQRVPLSLPEAHVNCRLLFVCLLRLPTTISYTQGDLSPSRRAGF
jgi:hypothetical protein